MDISVGAWGWRYPAWEKDVFYPDDLPEDWRLAYYSNEFDVVVISASYWEQEADEDWLDDVEDDFVFYIDWPTSEKSGAVKNCLEFIAQAGEQIGGILINSENFSLLKEAQSKQLSELSGQFNVRLYGGRQTSSEYPSVMNDTDEDSMASNEKLMLLHSSEDENLRDLTARLQKLLEGKNIEHIILAGEPPSIARLKELKTLVQLL